MKPREFWIESIGENDDVVHRAEASCAYKAPEQLVHVIEYSALEQLQAKLQMAKEVAIEILKTSEAYLFHACQPDRGDFFAEWDNKMREALKALEEK